MKYSGAAIRQATASMLSAALMLLLTGCAGTSPQAFPETPAPSTAAPAAEQVDSVQPVSRRALVDKALDNALTLRVRNSIGEEIALGSGFFIQGGHVVTNAHVVTDAAWVEIFDLRGRLIATAPYALAIDIENDLAVLPTPHSERQGLRLSEDRMQVGDDVWAFGAPLGLEGTTSRGVVSAFREKDGMDLIQITAPISPGSSGGPVLGESGDVIGIATLIMSGGQNLNFAVPVRKLRALQFTEANRESFPPGSAFDEELDEDIAQLVRMIVQMVESPTIEIGRQYRGRLDRDSPTLHGSPYSVYQLRGNAGQRLQIDLMSRQFDTVAFLARETGLLADDAWSVEDDDGGEGTDSRIVVTLPDTDTYYLLALSYDDRMGAYTLSARDLSPVQSRRMDGRWQFVDESVSDERFYIDTQTLSRSGRIATVWVRMSADGVGHLSSGERYDTLLMLFEFNCPDRRNRITATSYRLEGRLVTSEEIPSFRQTWTSVEPTTIAEAILEHACRR